jgi:predicted acetyltransferase
MRTVLALVEPSTALAESLVGFAQELARRGETFQGVGEGGPLGHGDVPEYLRRLDAMRRGQNLAPDRVPMSSYWLVADGPEVVGISRLRHRLTPLLRQHGGHIGFVVRPSLRRRGHGIVLLRLTLERARTRGLTRILLTCDSDNLGSRRVIEANGAILEAETISPVSANLIRQYWISL